jgi:hypothetical protein
MRFASIIFVVSLVACASPAQQATQQVPTAAMHFGEPDYVYCPSAGGVMPFVCHNLRPGTQNIDCGLCDFDSVRRRRISAQIEPQLATRRETMLMRLAYTIPILLLLAGVSTEEQARQQAVAGAAQILFADLNKCRIQGFQEGTDAFDQCVRMTIDQQSRPHRCTYCRSLD